MIALPWLDHNAYLVAGNPDMILTLLCAVTIIRPHYNILKRRPLYAGPPECQLVFGKGQGEVDVITKVTAWLFWQHSAHKCTPVNIDRCFSRLELTIFRCTHPAVMPTHHSNHGGFQVSAMLHTSLVPSITIDAS